MVKTPFLDVTIASPFFFSTVFKEDSKTTVPPLSVVIESSSAVPEAAPPMWNVLMVSCVPGSPIDCAATTPTASPM